MSNSKGDVIFEEERYRVLQELIIRRECSKGVKHIDGVGVVSEDKKSRGNGIEPHYSINH
jgi:hypothetical protein